MLYAGVARSIITPPVGIAMVGFLARGRSCRIDDELTVTALVIEQHKAAPKGASGPTDTTARVAVVGCDLLWSEAAFVRAVNEALPAIDCPPLDALVIASSHTHYGPMLDPQWDGFDPVVENYVRNLGASVAGAVLVAQGRARPCRLAAGLGRCRIGVNRRARTDDGQIVHGENPRGPYDDRVAVLRLDGMDGEPIAAVINAAAHPVSLGARDSWRGISPDFPAPARQIVEQHTGAMAMFLQGAAGDINPIVMGPEPTNPKRLGLPLGAEALRIYWQLRPATPAAGLGVARSRVQLGSLLKEMGAVRERADALEQELTSARALDNPGDRWWATWRLRRTREVLSALGSGQPAPGINADLTAIAFGGVGLVTTPGELFTELGQQILSRSPFPVTFHAGYANGSIGYLPTLEAYREGGYEATDACMVEAGSGEVIAEESVRLLHDAFQRGKESAEPCA